jgi:hypothetical protein
MSRTTWFRLFLVIILALNAEIDTQGQYYNSTRHLTRGADTAEIYISCWWYEDVNWTQWNGLFHSTDNGQTLTPMRKTKFFEESGVVHGDSISGRIFQVPMQMCSDTFGISFDYGVNFDIKSFDHIHYSVAGCMAGEIYIQENELGMWIYRSDDYGNTFTCQTTDNSLRLREVGTLPGELYCYKNDATTGPLGLAYSNDYGQTFTTSYLEFPGIPEFSECMIYRGIEPGEIYFVIYFYYAEIYLFHTFDYGQTITFQSQLPPAWGEVLYTAGRTPGTFYVTERDWTNFSVLYIYFSRDYGVTFTTYVHVLDSTYTENPSLPISSNPIKIYPNPVSDILTVELPENLADATVNLFDITGRLQITRQIPASQKKIQVDVSSLKAGIYLLNMTVQNRIIGVKKVVRW